MIFLALVLLVKHDMPLTLQLYTIDTFAVDQIGSFYGHIEPIPFVSTFVQTVCKRREEKRKKSE